MIIFKRLVLLAGLVCISSGAFSQNTKIDSLRQLLNTNLHDTTYINNAIDLAWMYMYLNSDTAFFYANKALEVAKEKQLDYYMASAYRTMGSSLVTIAQYDKAIVYLEKSLAIGKQFMEKYPKSKEYKLNVASASCSIGVTYYYLARYDKAIQNYMTSLKILEEIEMYNGMGICLNNLGNIYSDKKNYKKALEFYYRALEITIKTGNRITLSQGYNNIGMVYFYMGNFDSSYYYISRCVQINEAEDNKYDLTQNYNNLGEIFEFRHEYDSALICYSKSLNLSKELNSPDGQIDSYLELGKLYGKTNQFAKAEKHLLESLKLAEGSGTSYSVALANNALSDLYKAYGDFKKAYSYFVAGSKMHDSIFSAESDERIADIEAKYRTEKKEEEITFLKEKTALLDKQSKANKLLFSGIIIILILIIVLVIISYRSYKHKQLAEKRKIQQNAERKVLDAVIETEYNERKRFAEDLHDGLGVLLSTTRLYINEIEDSDKHEQKSLIAQSNALLDDAIGNARNIANNIMPAALKNNGLEVAVKSFCDKINASGAISIKVQALNLKKHYKNTLEITIYRMLTEMVNNTLKHARATEISISLVQKNSKLFVYYKDNGTGFDYEKMISSADKGMGLDNTISRIKSIGGSCDIVSSDGNGFFASIEVNAGT